VSLRGRDLAEPVVGVVVRYGKVRRVPRLPCVKVSRQVWGRGGKSHLRWYNTTSGQYPEEQDDEYLQLELSHLNFEVTIVLSTYARPTATLVMMYTSTCGERFAHWVGDNEESEWDKIWCW
jgi:hypothetical protein